MTHNDTKKTAQAYTKDAWNKLPLHKWVNGPHLIRLLPVPEQSRFGNILKFEEYNLFVQGAWAQNKRFAVCDDTLQKIYNALDRSVYNIRLAGKHKGNIKVQGAPRVAFLGLDLDVEDAEVEIFNLPGSFPKSNFKGGGTVLSDLITEAMTKGVDGYRGDVFDPEEGAIISITVENAGTREVIYTPKVEFAYPLSDSQLLQATAWEKAIKFYTKQEVLSYFRTYLPEEMWKIVEEAGI